MISLLTKIFFLKLVYLNRLWRPRRIPVLAYHSVSQTPSRLSLSPELFESHLKALQKHNYETLSLSEFRNILLDKKPLPHHKVLITFDDGYKDNLAASQLLTKYGFTAAFFICTKYINGRAGFANDNVDQVRQTLGPTDIQSLARQKFTIANHLHSHRNLTELLAADVKNEYQKSSTILMSITPTAITNVIAYPRNKVNQAVIDVLQASGVTLGFCGGNKVLKRRTKRLSIPRVEILNDSPLKLLARLSPLYSVMTRISGWLKTHRKSFFVILAVLVVKGILLSLVFNNQPNLNINNFKIPHGGDNQGYYQTATELAHFSLPSGPGPVGYPLLIAPLRWLWPQVELQSADLIFSIFNGLVVFTAAMLVIFLTIKNIFRRNTYAWLAIIFFLLLPYLFYYLAQLSLSAIPFAQNFQVSRTLQLLWLQSGSDYLASFLLFLLLYLSLFKWSSRPGFLAGLGVIASLAVITRPQNVVIFTILGLIFFLKQRRDILWFLLGALPLGLFQTVVNFTTTGGLINFGYDGEVNQDLVSLVEHGAVVFSPINLFKIFTYINQYNILIYIPILLTLTTFIVGAVYFYKNNRTIFLAILVSTIYAYFLTWFEPWARNPRYFIPLLPAILLTWFGFWEWGKNLRSKLNMHKL